MIGGNDVQSNVFKLADANTVSTFATQNHLAGVHFWSYDRDVDCPPGPASPVCNSLGGAGAHGFLRRFHSAGL
jgi:chitinase